ncbi:MAG: acyl-CoA/acyl-ACP dehydrogenase [Coprococcus sp.]|nr:acyl-CoA/acyl-ACP dehydrogenase [Coprococcus sp.]
MAVETYFWWTESQKKLAEELEKFVNKNVDDAERAYWSKEYPEAVMKRVGEKGLMGVGVPKEYGGSELGATGCCIVAEQLGRLPGVGNLFVIAMLAGLHQLINFGTEEQKRKWLPQIAEGKKLGTICITEPFVGSDASNINTTADFVDGHWVINGKKRMVSAAGIACRYLVYARTKRDDSDVNYTDITAFMVEKGTPGFHVEKLNVLVGYDNIPNGYLDFDNVVVEDANRIGNVGSGWEIMMSGLNFERLVAAAVVCGGMMDAIRYILHHTDRRVQFEKKISEFSNIQFDIAEYVGKLNMIRLYTYYTAAELDRDSKIRMDKTSIAKLYSTEWATQLGLRGIQVMGGDGLTKFYPVERLLRESKIGEVVAGTNEIQRSIIYRMAIGNRKFYKYPFRMHMDPEKNIPIQTSKDSEYKGVEINAENILKVLANDFRCNPALYMSISDIVSATGGKRKDILRVCEELEQEGLIFTFGGKRGTIDLVKANYKGLDKAFPKEFYRWIPEGYDETKIF